MHNFRVSFLIIFLNFYIVVPSFTNYAEVEFIKFRTHYTWLNIKIFNSVYYWCNKHTITVDEILSLIQSESNGDSKAISYAGAIGLMQVMPYPDRCNNAYELFSIDKNIEEGVQFYKWCKEYCKLNIDCTLKTYNAGPNKNYWNWAYIKEIKKNTATTKDGYKFIYELR